MKILGFNFLTTPPSNIAALAAEKQRRMGPLMVDPADIPKDTHSPHQPASPREQKTHKVYGTTLTAIGLTTATSVASRKLQDAAVHLVDKAITHAPDGLRAAANTTSAWIPEGVSSAAGGLRDTVVGTAKGLATTYSWAAWTVGNIGTIATIAGVAGGLFIAYKGINAFRGSGTTVHVTINHNGQCPPGGKPVAVNHQTGLTGAEHVDVDLCEPCAHSAKVTDMVPYALKARKISQELQSLIDSKHKSKFPEKLLGKMNRMTEKLVEMAENSTDYDAKAFQDKIKRATRLVTDANKAIVDNLPKERVHKEPIVKEALPYVFAASSLHGKLRTFVEDEARMNLIKEEFKAPVRTQLERLDRLADLRQPYNIREIKDVLDETKRVWGIALGNMLKNGVIVTDVLSRWRGKGTIITRATS